MQRGKKSLAQRIVFGAIDSVNDQNKDGDPLDVLNKALENVKPRLEVKSRRVGGATYQVPMEVPPERQLALAMRWMVGNAATRARNTAPGKVNRARIRSRNSAVGLPGRDGQLPHHLACHGSSSACGSAVIQAAERDLLQQ